METLSEKSKSTLLNIAEWTILNYLEHGKRLPLPEKLSSEPELQTKSGAFVSVYVKGKLRGCIGTFSEEKKLYKNIHKLSIQAAFEDNRFNPLTITEKNDFSVEVSVLTKRQKINTIDDIVIGKHGIYLVYGNRKGTLLPQVASENNFDKTEFLECCSKNKLGMKKNSWKECDIYIYEALVIR